MNVEKTKELIVSKKNCNLSIIPKIGLERVEVLRVLGIYIDKHLNFTPHVDYIVSKASQSLYAIKKLQNHGLKGKELEVVYRSLVLSKISYASQAWWGFANKENIIKLDNCVKKAVRWGIIGNKIFQDFQQSFKLYDGTLFKSILTNSHHTLHQLLPPVTTHSYDLRKRPHNRIITLSTNLFHKTFLGRMLHADTY